MLVLIGDVGFNGYVIFRDRIYVEIEVKLVRFYLDISLL